MTERQMRRIGEFISFQSIKNYEHAYLSESVFPSRLGRFTSKGLHPNKMNSSVQTDEAIERERLVSIDFGFLILQRLFILCQI
jgi:hypothetical protein